MLIIICSFISHMFIKLCFPCGKRFVNIFVLVPGISAGLGLLLIFFSYQLKMFEIVFFLGLSN